MIRAISLLGTHVVEIFHTLALIPIVGGCLYRKLQRIVVQNKTEEQVLDGHENYPLNIGTYLLRWS